MIATLRVKSDEGTFTDQSVQYAFQWPITEEDVRVNPGARMDGSWTLFYMWADWLAGTTPRIGDKIVDEQSRTWTVKKVETIVRGSQFRMTARRDIE